ncbi:MAG: ATP-binding protein [Terracidiphilus sp.]|jgi:heavy metal sensor kinase
MKALPIRIRLSLWYFAMFASAAVLLSITSFWMLGRSVNAAEHHELQERAEDVQLVLEHENPNQSIENLQREFTEIYQFKDDGKYLQVRDQDGNWIFRSKRMIQENPDLPAPDRIPPDGIQAEFHQGTRYVRVLAYPIVVRGKQYSVHTGIALNKSMALLIAFRNGLLLLTPAVILLAALGGHLMSRKALKPVADLAAQARLINDRNLDLRLPVPDTADEISDLSKTLNQMLERIDKAFASIRAFTGNASHELRTPISLLRAEIDVALFRPRDAEEYHVTLMRLNEEAVRMTNLVENLLSLARADGGAEAMSLAPIEVRTLFQSVHRTWAPAMHRAMLDFSIEAGGDGLVLLGDASGLQRLLSILLENASKFTPPGGSISLSATQADARVVVSVRDTGVGISEEDLPRIFDRFYRAAQTLNTAPRGSGLGLALAKWIAERHGTQLTVESRAGLGSCFTLSLEAGTLEGRAVIHSFKSAPSVTAAG